jgi:hypothetical protein
MLPAQNRDFLRGPRLFLAPKLSRAQRVPRVIVVALDLDSGSGSTFEGQAGSRTRSGYVLA